MKNLINYSFLTILLLFFSCSTVNVDDKPNVLLNDFLLKKENEFSLNYINKTSVIIDINGIPHINAKTYSDMFFAIGYLHAKDRGLQMIMVRILSEGKISEYLDSSDEMLEIDTFFRRMNWYNNIEEEEKKLLTKPLKHINAYLEGVNHSFNEYIPWEFELLGYKHYPFSLRDLILLSKLMGYISLVESQATVETLLVEMVQAGISKQKLNEFFPGLLNQLDVELLKKVNLEQKVVPKDIKWVNSLYKLIATNAWVVNGDKTVSGKPILANDPHLEVNRLPAVWYELSAVIGGNANNQKYIMGATVPGLPGFIIGRTNKLAWGFSYSFTDAIDYWVEDCKNGKCRRKDEYIKLNERKEIIKRKGKKDHIHTFYDSEHGVLLGNPNVEGFYLSVRWATGDNTGAVSLNVIDKIIEAENVKQGMDLLGKLETSWNLVFADSQNNIGFQMCGIMPIRTKDNRGLVPLNGWDEQNNWKGFIPYNELPKSYNPKKGYFVAANQNLNHFSKHFPVNMPMGSYRADRISSILENKSKFTAKDMAQIQYDVYSLQAEKYMKILKPILPDSKYGKILSNWDYLYNPSSKGAYLFEQFYMNLIKEVFGKSGKMGEKTIDYIVNETGVFIDFYENVDRILLSEKSSWFNNLTREQLYKKALNNTMNVTLKSWGEYNQMKMNNILFAGKLPGFLGYDIGPFAIRGGRATPHQGQLYKSANRATSFLPSYRFITDMKKHEILTNLPGGPSDRHSSKWYDSDLNNWLNGVYKRIRP